MFKCPRHRLLGGCILLSLLLTFGGSARAHLGLDTPAGGEVLQAGSVFVLTWQILIPHESFENWNLWYATDNDLNWIPIVADLPLVDSNPMSGSTTRPWLKNCTPLTGRVVRRKTKP